LSAPPCADENSPDGQRLHLNRHSLRKQSRWCPASGSIAFGNLVRAFRFRRARRKRNSAKAGVPIIDVFVIVIT